MSDRLKFLAMALAGQGIFGVEPDNCRIVCPASGTYAQNLVGKVAGEEYYSTVAAAYASLTTGLNNALFLAPESHSQAAALTFDKNLTHVIGMYPPAVQNQRSRFGHSANFSPMATVSGYGNLFSNLYWSYGRGSASNVNLLNITGPRNTFLRNHFLCAHATELDQATFRLIKLAHSETYFKDCFFGQDTVAWTNGAMIEFGAQADPPRVVFDNCTFLMNTDNAQVFFLKVLAGCGAGLALFKKCQFINIGTSLTYAIDGAGLGNFKLAFDSDCYFAGVTDVVAAAYTAHVFAPAANTSAATYNNALGNLMTIAPLVS